MAILMVAAGHSAYGFARIGVTALDFVYRLPISTAGVTVFFVLSGFLITNLLVSEQDRTGRISLRTFYLRRFFRIVPAYYVFLTSVLVLSAFGRATVPRSGILPAYLFIWNYSPHADGWWFGHTWSLSMEEQFYLLWPACVALLGRRGSLRLAIGVILTAPAVRIVTYLVMPGFRGQIGAMLHTHADALMFGAAAALAQGSEAFERRLRLVFSRRLHLVAAALFVVNEILIGHLRGRYALPVGMSLEGACIVILLLWLIRHPESRIGKILNARAVVFVGAISYSLYLWQQAFLRPVDEGVTSRPPLSLALAFLAGLLSYRLIEKPILRWRDRVFNRPEPQAALGASPREPEVSASPAPVRSPTA